MRLRYFVTGAIILLLVITLPLEGKHILMLPLSAQEVYRILKQAGKEDAVPEGRVVSQGIAAVSGFALGLAKGVGGTALLGAAALSGLTGLASLTASANTGCCQQQSQEVCFTSRSLNEINDSEEEEDDPEGRQEGTPTSITNVDYTDAPHTRTSVSSPASLDYATPSTDGTTDAAGTGTDVDNRGGTGTRSGTTTETGTRGAVNCVVVQTPCSSCSSG